MSCGVLAGTNTPNQKFYSEFANPASTVVGKLGKSGALFVLLTARASNLLSRINPNARGSGLSWNAGSKAAPAVAKRLGRTKSSSNRTRFARLMSQLGPFAIGRAIRVWRCGRTARRYHAARCVFISLSSTP
jgi:hypothetical protein